MEKVETIEAGKGTRACQVRVGDEIEYHTLGGGVRVVDVTELHADIKNGWPGFEGIVVERTRPADLEVRVWGYADQITRVQGNPVNFKKRTMAWNETWGK